MVDSYGIDIASYRLDDVDKKALHFALNFKGRKVAVDFGCGEGRVAKLLALMGFEVWTYDIRDMAGEFASYPNIHFTNCDIDKLTAADLPEGIVIAVAQRTLHHLPFVAAQNILRHLNKKMHPTEGRLFLSLSGLHSKLAEGYVTANIPLEERYGEVGELGKEIYKITDKVCLYEKTDVQKLLAASGFMIDELWESSFGNIKSISSPSLAKG